MSSTPGCSMRQPLSVLEPNTWDYLTRGKLDLCQIGGKERSSVFSSSRTDKTELWKEKGLRWCGGRVRPSSRSALVWLLLSPRFLIHLTKSLDTTAARARSGYHSKLIGCNANFNIASKTILTTTTSTTTTTTTTWYQIFFLKKSNLSNNKNTS